MYTYDFQLAGKIIRLVHNQRIKINPNFSPFLVEGKQADCIVSFRERQNLLFCTKASLYSNVSFSVYFDGEGYFRQYMEYREDGKPYALNRIAQDGTKALVEYLPQFSSAFSEAQNSFSHIAIDELMLHQKRMILHASFVSTQYGGLLFSGPSQIGKSTQARLWAEYEDGEIINGDRPILGKEQGIWHAWGSPYAGSSGYHVAKGCAIRAILILEKANENQLQRMSFAEAFKHLYSETTVNTWNTWYVNCVLDMIGDLVQSVPVYRLQCRPDATAVDILKKQLIEVVAG